MEDSPALKKFIKAQESLVVQQSDFSLRTITEMVEDGAVDIAPHYQRRDRWKVTKQSGLIESFILNVPVPPIYLSEDDYGVYSVIDGKQRITAVKNFLNDEYRLKNLKNFPELEGFLFSELPQKIKNALSVRPYLRVVTLLRQSDPGLKFEVFLRLNTGGEHLKPQEVRNVAYAGSLNNLLFELSENDELKRKLKIIDSSSTAYRNMEDLEHILRFFTLYERWEGIGNVLATEMDKYMATYQKASIEKIDSLRNLFIRTIHVCADLWEGKAFNKPINGGWREQLISPLYDAQMVATAMILMESKFDSLKDKSVLILQETRLLFDDMDFNKAVSQATNNPRNIQYRIGKMYEMLNNLSK